MSTEFRSKWITLVIIGAAEFLNFTTCDLSYLAYKSAAYDRSKVEILVYSVNF